MSADGGKPDLLPPMRAKNAVVHFLLAWPHGGRISGLNACHVMRLLYHYVRKIDPCALHQLWREVMKRDV